jgi:hypothetical protein
MKQLELMPEPEPEALELSKHYASDEYMRKRGDRISYRAQQLLANCDECTLVLFEHRGNAPLTRRTKIRRTITRNGTKRLLNLCHQHGRMWRERDGL